MPVHKHQPPFCKLISPRRNGVAGVYNFTIEKIHLQSWSGIHAHLVGLAPAVIA